MTEWGFSFDQYLQQIRFELSQPIDLAQTDPESLPRNVSHLSIAAVYFNILAVSQFGGRLGAEREPGLVMQVVAAFQSFGGHEPHPEPFDRAAVLLRGITQGHPFTDGNKRTGFLLAPYYLEKVGFPRPDRLPEGEIIELAQQLSSGESRDLDEVKRALLRIYGIHAQ